MPRQDYLHLLARPRFLDRMEYFGLANAFRETLGGVEDEREE